jgi:homocysteine S-methyltransferase
VLRAAGADLLAIETLPSLREAAVLVELAAGDAATRAWVSFSCRDERSLRDGTPIVDAARALDTVTQIVAVGVNCTAPEHVAGLIGEIRRGTSKPVVVYPNSGETWDAGARRWSGDADANSFVDLARSWFAGGARAVGGCCRVGPAIIRRLARMNWDSAV